MAGHFGPFTQEAVPAAMAAARVEASAKRGFPGSSDTAWKREQEDMALERKLRFAKATSAPPAEKKVIAWAGGKITSNKAEAMEAFIERKRQAGQLDPGQAAAMRATLDLKYTSAAAKIELPDGQQQLHESQHPSSDSSSSSGDEEGDRAHAKKRRKKEAKADKKEKKGRRKKEKKAAKRKRDKKGKKEEKAHKSDTKSSIIDG